MQGILDGRGFDELYDAENVGGTARTSFGTDDASTVTRLLRFVDDLPEGARFFAVYSPISGHHPYRAPGRRPSARPEHSEQDAYFNDLYSGDRAFGELVDGFEKRGRLEKTLFVVVGDHGEAFGQHVGNFAHTLFLYDENVRVPFVIAAPGLVRGRVRAPQVTSLVDIAPTTLALLGMPPEKESEGRSALEPVSGAALFMADQGPLKLGARRGAFKCIHETEHDRTRLFDLTADPAERVDLAEALPARAAECRTSLRGWAGIEEPR
jgi:arylsulfatase A-like enzyme